MKRTAEFQASSEQSNLGLQQIGKTLLQAGKDLFYDGGPQWAAAIAYYSLLSAFPLLLAAASIASFFIDPEWAVDQATRLLGEFLPGTEGTIAETVKEALEARGSVSLLSILALLWSGSRVFGSVTRALNIAFDADETYSFLRRTLVELIMLLTIGILFILTLASRTLIRLLWGRIEFLPSEQSILYQVILEAVPELLLLITFYLAYRFVPRQKVDHRAALCGAFLATVLFMAARPLFLGYIQNLVNYNLIYGSLSVVIILIVWAWISALILLFGGEVASHVQMMLIEGQEAEEVEQRHLKRSPVRSK